MGAVRETRKPVKRTWTYTNVAAILSAQAYLRSLPCVDENRVGVVGISWGGVLSLIALKNAPVPFAAGAIIYSAGYVTEDTLGMECGWLATKTDKERYDFCLDPRNYVGKISPVLFQAGLVDGAFSATSRTRLTRLLSGEIEHAYLPDLWHDNTSNFKNETVFSYMDEKLKNEGKRLRLTDVTVTGEEFVCRYENETPVKAELYWATERSGFSRFWKWNTVSARIEGNEIHAEIPQKANRVVLTVYQENGLYASTEMKEVLR